MKLPTAPWIPDQPDFGNPGLVRAVNVIPAADHYLSFPSAASLGLSNLTGAAEGLTVGFPPGGGDPVLFTAFGGHLWRIPGTTAPPVDASEVPATGYTMFPGDRWVFHQYGSMLLATNFNDQLQRFELSNLSNSFEPVPNAPKARYMARIRDFIMLGYVDEPPDGVVSYRLRWHGFDPATGLPDITQWTIALNTRSDFQDIADVGEMTGLTGGDIGIALFLNGIARIDYGGQYLFNARVVDDTHGCTVPGSVVRYGDFTYYWSTEGLYRTNGGPAQPVGTERINRYIQKTFDQARADDVWAYPDRKRGTVLWIVPTKGQGSIILVYKPSVDQFSVLDVDLDSIGPVVSFGLDLDDVLEFPNLDTDPRNLDDPQLWVSGLVDLGGQIESVSEAYDPYEDDPGDLIILNGDALEGVLEWPEMEPGEGNRFVVNLARVYQTRGSATLSIFSREAMEGEGSDLVHYGPYTPQSDGWYRFRALGRFLRARVTLKGNWQTARGLDVRGSPLGFR